MCPSQNDNMVCALELSGSNFFVPWEPKGFFSTLLEWGTEQRDWRQPKRTLLSVEMLWLYGWLLSSHCLTFRSEEKYFRLLKAAVNG